MAVLDRLSRVDRLNRWAGYLYVPYQFLQALGYRLVSKPCNYQWGQYGVQPIGLVTRPQHVFAGLFPTAVCCAILTLQFILSIYLFARYYSPQSPWIVVLIAVQPVPFSLYAYLMIFDMLRVRRLLRSGSEPARPAQPDHDEGQ